jgi:hypothetical protein
MNTKKPVRAKKQKEKEKNNNKKKKKETLVVAKKAKRPTGRPKGSKHKPKGPKQNRWQATVSAARARLGSV